MTFQPPPPPPPPAGPPPGGPPPGAWGPPGRPGQPFDPKSVNQLDWGILGAGVLAFIFSFVSYYTVTVSGGGFSATGSENAWHGFFGWFAMFCALAGSALVAMVLFAPQVKLPVPARLAGLGLYTVATLCVILALFVFPGGSYSGPGIDEGHGFGYWISLIVIIAGLVLSLMRFQQTGGQLPGALANMPTIGGHRPGGPAGPPPGYAPPVQSPPQAQGPPAGYAPPPPPPPTGP
ncbi:MAG: hypothetical protein ACRDWT_10065 [Jatrophihabitantaceae bacterium]